MLTYPNDAEHVESDADYLCDGIEPERFRTGTFGTDTDWRAALF
jgi:hypothetical protein